MNRTTKINVLAYASRPEMDINYFGDIVEYLSSNYEDVSKTTVIQKAYDWNKKVYNAQYWSNNIWTNWFWSKKYVDSLKYIELR